LRRRAGGEREREVVVSGGAREREDKGVVGGEEV